jgi:hypothetical protein
LASNRYSQEMMKGSKIFHAKLTTKQKNDRVEKRFVGDGKNDVVDIKRRM